MSIAIGHHHTVAGVEYISTEADHLLGGYTVWGMATGSLINVTEYAFKYGRDAKRQPMIGAGVVFDDGRVPMWIPID